LLVIEREVDDRADESVRSRRALRGVALRWTWVVVDEALVRRRPKVRGSMVERVWRKGRMIAES
jgi:hypothetical protein